MLELLERVEYGLKLWGDDVALVNDSFALLYDSNRSHGLLVELLEYALALYRVISDVGLEGCSEFCRGQGALEIMLAQCAVKGCICLTH